MTKELPFPLKSGMTVGDLRRAMSGLPEDVPVEFRINELMPEGSKFDVLTHNAKGFSALPYHLNGDGLPKWEGFTISVTPNASFSAVQPWVRMLRLQQQSVLVLALRGPDGIAKDHPCKELIRRYRGTVLNAAKFGRPIKVGEKCSFMMPVPARCPELLSETIHDLQDCNEISRMRLLEEAIVWRCMRYEAKTFLASTDELPHHHLMHFVHAAEIVGYKHPNPHVADFWRDFYLKACEDAHMNPETVEQMDERLSDWGREHWED